MKTIHENLDALIQRQRLKITRDDGKTEWRTVRSLWELLQRATSMTGGSGSGSSSKKRLPISATVLDLVMHIESEAASAALALTGSTRDDTPQNLRAIAATVSGRPEQDEWNQNIQTWTRQAKTILHMDPDLPRWIRGQACPNCHATKATGNDGVEQTQVPALGLVWVGPEDEEEAARPDAKWTMRAVTCGACTHTWWSGSDFEILFQQMMDLNLTRETLTDPA